MKKERKNKNYWTNEKCVIEALKYNKRSQFKRYSCGAYVACKRHGWLDNVCSHMKHIGNRFNRLVYVYEFDDKSVYIGLTFDINERDKKHKRDRRSSVYKHIKKTNLTPKLTYSKFMNIEDAKKTEALTIEKYKDQEFTILNISKAGGVGGGYLKWTFEKCKEEALKCKTRKEFYKKSNSAYNSARRYGWMDEVCSHMPKENKYKKGYWTRERCEEEVKKYKARDEIYKKSPGAYMAMIRNGWLNIICSHLKTKKPNGYWTLERCKNEALKYNSKKDFVKNSGGAYRTAIDNKWINIICYHMKKQIK